MRLLLDTHLLLWTTSQSHRLSHAARTLFDDRGNELFFSAASYRITRGTLVVGTTTSMTFTDALLWPQTSYSYRMDALGAGGAVLSTTTASQTTTPLPATGFQRPFPAKSFWNTPVSAAPQVGARNVALMSYFTAHLKYPNMPLHAYGVSLAEAHPSDTKYGVPCTRYTCSLGAFGPFPIPRTAVPDAGSDGHLAVIDPSSQREWDLWQATTNGSSWTASAGSAVSMLGKVLKTSSERMPASKGV